VNVELAETPIWDPRNGKIYWTDLFPGDVYEYDPVTGKDRKWETGKMIGAAVPSEDPSELFVALEDGMYRMNKASGDLTLIANPEPGNDKNRFNDSRIDAAGRIFTSSVAKTGGTAAFTPDQTGNFYMIERDGTVKVIMPDIQQYNTMLWNKNSTKMYVSDTYNQKLLVWDYDLAGGPSGKPKVGIDFSGKQGTPDGLTLDSEGNLYVFHWTGKISVWDKDLKWKEDIAFQVEQVTCGGFAGPDMKDLYVATARFQYTPEQMENRKGAGGFFKARSEIAGNVEHFLKK
jgi:sugar lactone lactonase YvrE